MSHSLSVILHSLSLQELALLSLRQMSFQVVDDTKMLGRCPRQRQPLLLSLRVTVSSVPKGGMHPMQIHHVNEIPSLLASPHPWAQVHQGKPSRVEQ